MMFQKGGNAVDAAAAMLAATCTMWDTLGWGGETQALIWNPKTGKVVAINALGVAPTGATPEFYHGKNMRLPAGVRPPGRGDAGHAGRPPGDAGRVRQAVASPTSSAPAIQMADGYPIEAPARRRASSARRRASRSGRTRAPSSSPTRARPARRPGPARSSASPTSPPPCASWSRPSARRSPPARAARRRSRPPTTASTRGTSPRSSCAAPGSRAASSPARTWPRWQVKIEEPVKTSYKGIDVYKLDHLDAGPGHAPGPQPPRAPGPARHGAQQRPLHPHALPGHEPGLRRPRLLLRRPRLSAGGAAAAGCSRRSTPTPGASRSTAGPQRPGVKPGDPYPFQGQKNPYLGLLEKWGTPAERRQWRSRTAGLAPCAANDLRRGLPRGHDLDHRGRRGGLGRLGHAERRLDPRLHRRQDRHRPLPAHAELRARRGGEPVQRARARQAAAGDAHAQPGAQGRQALPGLRGPGRRHARTRTSSSSSSTSSSSG